MSRSLRQRAFALFDELCDLEEPHRTQLLNARCGGNAQLRTLVERMFIHDTSADEATDLRPGSGAQLVAAEVLSDDANAMPERIGRYRVVREIGRGGMGVVYEAEQEEPRRRVAVKVMREGFASAEARRRFRREAHLLGQLQHRGIAHVYEAGTATIGHSDWPFFAMEFIDGRSIDQHADAVELGITERLELIARVADAVQHAHQKGILHRDLKMANVLVVSENGTRTGTGESTIIDMIGQPKVLDFGVARLTEHDPSVSMNVTRAGQMVGTLAYMNPEQLSGDVQNIDTRSDVYALGVMLFALLTDRMPLDVQGKGIGEATRLIREVDPPRLGTIDPRLRGDVETIVARALEKDPDRRYGSAAEFADDIRRSLRDEPIRARPATALYKARKFTARNRVLVGGVAATFVALICGLIVMSVLLHELSQQRDAAEEASRRTGEVALFQQELLANLSARRVGDDTEQAVLDEYGDALKQAGATEEEIASSVARLGEMLESVNETNLGREVLQKHIAESAIVLLDAGFTDDLLVEADIRKGLADVMRSLGDFAAAREQMEKAVQILEAERGRDARSTMGAQIKLAEALVQERMYGDAEPMLRPLHERSERLFGLDDLITIRAATQLGILYARTERFDQAVDMQHVALEGARRIQSPKRICNVLNELGVIAMTTGEPKKAISYFNEILKIAEDTTDIPRPTRITVTNNLMTALFRIGRVEEAAQRARDAVPLFAEQYGDEHQRTIMARNNLARVLLDLGESEEPASILDRQYELSIASLDPAHEVRQAVSTNYIEALLLTGRPQEAEVVARNLLESRRNASAPSSGAMAQTLEQLGLCLLALERFSDALTAFEECATLRQSIDPNHWLTSRARSYQGAALSGMGRFEDAEPLMTEAADHIRTVSDSIAANMREREIRKASERVADMYDSWGRPDDADTWRTDGSSG